MRIEIMKDAGELSRAAADLICDAVRVKRDARLGLPTGGTPILTYRELARRIGTDCSTNIVYAIDEFAGVPSGTAGTNSAFYREHLRISAHAVHCPDSGAADPEREIASFAEAIGAGGGLDLCVLGLGVNGHIAFNEPGSRRESRARVVALTPETRRAHAQAFGSLDLVPALGMTLGVADLMAVRSLCVIVQGAHKAAIARAAIEGPRTPDVPASWLQQRADVIWMLDAAAAAALSTTRTSA